MLERILSHFQMKCHKPAEIQRSVIASQLMRMGTEFFKMYQTLLRVGPQTRSCVYLLLGKYELRLVMSGMRH